MKYSLPRDMIMDLLYDHKALRLQTIHDQFILLTFLKALVVLRHCT